MVISKSQWSQCRSSSEHPPRLSVTAVVDYLYRWSPGKNPSNTVHIDDIAGALWACAQWMAPLGRKTADSLAGEEIFFHNEKKKVKEVEGMPLHNQKLVAPLFNLVRDSDYSFHFSDSLMNLSGRWIQQHTPEHWASRYIIFRNNFWVFLHCGEHHA